MPDFKMVERDGDMLRRSYYDESSERMFEEVLQDVTEYLKFCKELRESQPQHGPKYKKTLTMVSSIPMAFALKMLNGQCCAHYGKRRVNVKFNIWGNPDEYKQALLHIQSHHKDLLTMTGKPIDRPNRGNRAVA